jgi:transposase
MLIIGCDYHPSMQQIAYVDTETEEGGERRLMHRDGEAERFYRELKQRQIDVRVGMEATGYARWFERLLAELGFELWIGDPARIRARRVRKQKTDRKDAQLLLQLLLEKGGFPQIWVPSPENRDLRQLLLASTSSGTNANTDHEPTASRGHERRATTQAGTME